MYWGLEGNWWKSEGYEDSLRSMNADDMKKVVLVGKVAFREGKKYVVALFANKEHNDLCYMPPNDVWRFLRDKALIGMKTNAECWFC